MRPDAPGSDVLSPDAAKPGALDPNAYERLIQSVVDYAIYMLDPQGRVSSWNPGAARIKGYSADEIVGEHFSRFYTPEDRADGLPQKVLKQAATEGRYAAEGWRVRKDGSKFWAMVVIDPIREGDEIVGFAKITRDVTHQREAQIELERSQSALFQAQKMEAVGQLTGGLAHDFNNLLTGITGSLDLIKARLAQGRTNELDRYITAARGAAQRAATLTHRLLAFSRQQTLEPKAIDANRLITNIEELIRRSVGPSITIETVLAVGLWPCFCDPHQLENAILNLCINARDAMLEGGSLTIETANTWVDHRTAGERDMPPGQFIAVSVTDTGVGMTPDVVARAFDPFFTTKPIGQGTGLGLSMIYGFAKQSNGEVRIYSEVGQGTTVKIYLPRHHGEAAEDLSAQTPQAMPRPGAGEIVLVVDDEPTVRMLVADTLADLGYQSIEAVDAASGMKVLESDMTIDLLITDVGLPGGVNGKQLADTARARRPELKVLFITGYAENAAVSNGHLEAGMRVLSKPFPMEKLAACIRSIIEDKG
ncbi:MAG TPA: PAS domain S-box protein [Caulobacteraceae bacterium]|nr:PAS domain S-box protein [Caulobacteraceae bacterium]